MLEIGSVPWVGLQSLAEVPVRISRMGRRRARLHMLGMEKAAIETPRRKLTFAASLNRLSPMSRKPSPQLTVRVRRCAAQVMQAQGLVTYPALLQAMDILSAADYKAWQTGKIPFLERAINSNLT